MSSVFYNDVLLQITSLSNDHPTEMPETVDAGFGGSTSSIAVDLLVDKVDNVKRLIFCSVLYGHLTTKTTMQQQEDVQNTVEFNHVLPLNIGLKDTSDNGLYIPSVQYIVIDIYAYSKDKTKFDEFLGRVMVPVCSLTTTKHKFVLTAGQSGTHTISSSPVVTCYATITNKPRDFVGWYGLDTFYQQTLDNGFQYKAIISNKTVDFPGTFEMVELCIPKVNVVICDEKFVADVYLTNFRVVFLARDIGHRHYSNWISFPSIIDIEKSYVQNSYLKSMSKRCYTITCLDARIIRVYVPAVTRGQRFIKQRREQLETKFSKGVDSRPNIIQVVPPKVEIRSPSICSSDGEARDGLSENDQILGDELFEPSGSINSTVSINSTGVFSEDELSDDELLDYKRARAHTDYSDAESLDSMDNLEVESRFRGYTGNSVSSFTSYIINRTKSQSKEESKVSRAVTSKYQHTSKTMMDNLRLRVFFHKYNPSTDLPWKSISQNLSADEISTFRKFKRYKVEQEHIRQGDMRHWVKLDNTSYNLCKSYPPLFYIPVQISAPEVLRSILDFRSKCRIPGLCWLNDTGAVLLRSAQPRTGILHKHCKEDSLYLSIVHNLSVHYHNNDLPFMIFDARSKIAASGNQMKGKGTEVVTNYDNTKLVYLNMANIHAVRESYDKLTGLSQIGCTAKWLLKLEQSQWLGHVQGLVRGACSISKHLISNGAALIHCSDGWDRTSQLTSLSLLYTDPFYRTFEGFQILLEREWLSFGHRFHDRLGLAHPSQRSPIFLLFLDSIHQTICQYPTMFEFTQDYLLVLADLHSSGWTVTFLHNCHQERCEDGLEIWGVLDGMRDTLTNPKYYLSTTPLVPKSSLRHLRLWREYFLRYDWWSDLLAEDMIGPVVWVPDDTVITCHSCEETFSTLKRRHHCRLCGNIFCGTCAKRKISLPERGYNTPVLVCNTCYQEHTSIC